MRHGDLTGFEPRTEEQGRSPLRGSDSAFSRGSMLFDDLAPIAMLPGPAGQPSERDTKAALLAITSAMVGPSDLEEASDLSLTPAGFTYFGQFVFHDMVFSRVFGLASGEGHHLKNAVSPGLDLTGLYGRGRLVDPHLYDAATPSDNTTCRFPLGLPRKKETTPGLKQGRIAPVEARQPGRDLPRIDTGGRFMTVKGPRSAYRPLVADPRNDNNLVLSQLLATLMEAHNRLVDVQVATGAVNPALAYENARRYMIAIYRRVVITDYLRRILMPAILDHFFDGPNLRGVGVSGLPKLGGLPIEFTFGASRFAHAMVRQFYRVNASFEEEAGTLPKLLTFSSQRPNGDVPIPENWTVDWQRFTDHKDNPPASIQHARRISPFLSHELTVPGLAAEENGTERSVAFMDTWRCYDLELPSGQTVAAALRDKLQPRGIAVPTLEPHEILPTAACTRRYVYHAGELRKAIEAAPRFKEQTPLSYYILQEASVLGDDGNQLGPVGSYIVAATVAGSLFRIPDADINPHSLAGAGHPLTLADVLRLHDSGAYPDAELLRLLRS